jgi:NAD(P)-dependent dehydrogenase (short-subunit alcohol dehydrogenase family)
MKNTLQGKTVVIAGGCGQIGYASAKRLASLGARIVALVRRDIDQAQAMMQSLPGPELEHFAILASVIDTDSLRLAVQQVKQRTGRCDILINAAGILIPVPPTDLHGLTDEIFDKIVTTNLRGVYATIREFSDLLKQADDAVIINISSQSGLRASNSCIAYAVSKAGIDLMTMTLAKYLAPTIRVIGIAPGYLEHATSGVVRVNGNADLESSSPLKCLATGDDIAATIEAYITMIKHATGTTLLVDGGRLL